MSITLAAEPNYTPMQALEKFQKFAFAYGGYYYKFSQDGAFSSWPLGQQGRTLRGTWKTADGTNFMIIAKLGWMNSLNPPGDYYRIVFHICRLRNQTPKPAGQATPIVWGAYLFDGHYFIDEFVRTEKPKRDETKAK